MCSPGIDSLDIRYRQRSKRRFTLGDKPFANRTWGISGIDFIFSLSEATGDGDVRNVISEGRILFGVVITMIG